MHLRCDSNLRHWRSHQRRPGFRRSEATRKGHNHEVLWGGNLSYPPPTLKVTIREIGQVLYLNDRADLPDHQHEDRMAVYLILYEAEGRSPEAE